MMLFLCAMIFLFIVALIAVLNSKQKLTQFNGDQQSLLSVVSNIIPTIFYPAKYDDINQIGWKYILDTYERYGSIYKTYFGRNAFIVVSDPDFFELVAKKGDKIFNKKIPRSIVMKQYVGDNLFNTEQHNSWKRYKLLLTPAFSDTSLDFVHECTVETMYAWFEKVDKINKRGIIRDMLNISLEVIGLVGFGYNFNAIEVTTQRNPNYLLNVLLRINQQNGFFTLSSFLRDKLAFVPWVSTLHRDIDIVKSIIKNIIENRKTNGWQRRDILSLLLDATGNELKSSSLLTEEELIANCWIMLVAGHDTVGRSLGLVLRMLALHPDVQQKARNEVDNIFDGSHPTMDQISDLNYLNMIIKETMRLYPVSIGTTGFMKKDVKIRNFFIKKDTTVMLNWYNCNLDEKYWGPNVMEFVPERWENGNHDNKYYFTPFGMGTRVCMGQKFSHIEMMTILSMILKRYVLKPYGYQELLFEESSFRVRNPISLKFEKRE